MHTYLKTIAEVKLTWAIDHHDFRHAYGVLYTAPYYIDLLKDMLYASIRLSTVVLILLSHGFHGIIINELLNNTWNPSILNYSMDYDENFIRKCVTYIRTNSAKYDCTKNPLYSVIMAQGYTQCLIDMFWKNCDALGINYIRSQGALVIGEARSYSLSNRRLACEYSVHIIQCDFYYGDCLSTMYSFEGCIIDGDTDLKIEAMLEGVVDTYNALAILEEYGSPIYKANYTNGLAQFITSNSSFPAVLCKVISTYLY